MDLRVRFLDKPDLDHIVAVGDDRRDLKKCGDLSGIIAEEIVHPALYTRDKTDAVPDLTGPSVTDSIIDERKIRLVKRRHHDISFFCRTVLFIIDIDHKGIIVHYIFRAVKQPHHRGAGFRRPVRINDARSQDLRKQLSRRVVNLLPGRTVKLRLCQLHMVLLTIKTDPHKLALIHIQKVRAIGIDLFYDLRFRIILCHKSPSQNTEMLQEGVTAAGDAVRALPAHRLPKERIISGCHHDAEPVCHIVGLLPRGDKEHQRHSGRAAGGIVIPVFVFRILRLFIHPRPQLILREKRELRQIISRADVLRSHPGPVKPFLIKWNLIRLLYQLSHPFILDTHHFRKILRDLCFHFKQIKKKQYID